MALKISRLRRVRAGLTAAVDRGVFRAAGQVLDLAKQLAPVDTGALRASGHLVPPEADGSRHYRVVFGGDNVDYARYVEEGTDNPNYPAQPYLGPAKKEIRVRVAVAEELRELLRGGA